MIELVHQQKELLARRQQQQQIFDATGLPPEALGAVAVPPGLSPSQVVERLARDELATDKLATGLLEALVGRLKITPRALTRRAVRRQIADILGAWVLELKVARFYIGIE